MDDIREIPINLIWAPEEFNCRDPFALASVEGLANELRDKGQLYPVDVQPMEDVAPPRPLGYDFRLAAGFRRYTAIKYILRWPTIRCNVRSGLSEEQASDLNFVENFQRKQLNPMEEAKYIAKRFPPGTPALFIARTLNTDKDWVVIRQQLMLMPEEIQQKVSAGQFSNSDLELIAAQKTPEAQLQCSRDLLFAHASKQTARIAERYGRKNRKTITKKRMTDLIDKMFVMGLHGGIGPRTAAYCAGFIEDDEIEEDIRAEISRNERLMAQDLS